MSAYVDALGWVKLVPAVAHHLLAAFTQPGASTLTDLCTERDSVVVMVKTHALERVA